MGVAEIEKAKLTAGFFNSLASGAVLASIAAPYIGWGMGTSVPSADFGNILGLSGFGCTVGLMLHLIARRIVGGIT